MGSVRLTHSNTNSIVSFSLADETNETGEDTLERLRNITKMFASKNNEDENAQPLQKMERFAPSDKIRNTFQK